MALDNQDAGLGVFIYDNTAGDTNIRNAPKRKGKTKQKILSFEGSNRIKRGTTLPSGAPFKNMRSDNYFVSI
ncbi:hypothetical protein HR09_02825 [Porphyromonas gulae]|nr:hypothetical protein HQ50_09045 [Porphyromonas sp. COT-052 OH4946]KGN70090.1 hypothetical protein HR09_02825 [Porphyromonas gulae]